MEQQRVQELRSAFGGPRSDAETEVLEDLKGFIEFGLRNGLTFVTLIGTLAHDINGLYRYGFDLDAAARDAFQPKTKGYSGISADDVGESEEPDDSE